MLILQIIHLVHFITCLFAHQIKLSFGMSAYFFWFTSKTKWKSNKHYIKVLSKLGNNVEQKSKVHKYSWD